jgi:hypothetical protein
MKLILPEKGLIAAPFVKRRLVAERFRTVDTAFTFRMGAGFAGDVNRGHPCSIQPCLIDSASPPTAYGQAVVVDSVSEGVRPIGAGDGAVVDLWGVTVRPYPIQQSTTSSPYGEVPYGGAGVPSMQPIDVLRGGYIFVAVNILNGAVNKGGSVFVWYTASGGGHTQGGFESAASGGNTIALSPAWSFNSPTDSTGVAELICSRF